LTVSSVFNAISDNMS